MNSGIESNESHPIMKGAAMNVQFGGNSLHGICQYDSQPTNSASSSMELGRDFDRQN